MRFLLLLFLLSLVNPTVGEAKPKGKIFMQKPLEIGNSPAEMPYLGGKKPVYRLLYTIGTIDTGGGARRYIPSKPAKATKPKIRHKTKKTKRAPDVLGPNDKCFIPKGEDLTAAK